MRDEIRMSISPPNEHSQNFNLDKKISPTILLIIVILSIIFFILGLVHLLIRLLIKPTQNDQEDLLDHVTVLQGQLQQLFHLHDSGVDQSYIDTLPVFYYKSIIGLKDPFDCAVCLCEFDLNDRLRLLPKCSHAFHMECIDTWLLSHSTCPLCRSSLLLEYGNHNNGYSPIVCVLESGASVVDNNNNNSREIDRSLSGLSGLGLAESGSGQVGFFRKSCDEKVEEEKIVVVKLGKFRNVDIGEGSSESNFNNTVTADTAGAGAGADVNSSCGNDDLESRRCFSMGSFAYVLDETTSLQVPIRNTPMRKQTSKTKKPSLPLKPGNRVAMSEYGCDSCREFNGIDAFKTIDNLSSIDTGAGGDAGAGTGNGKSHLQQANVTERSRRRESFSISRIWSRRGNGNESSRRMNSEIKVDNVSELGGDEETQSCYSVDSIVNPTTTTSTTSNYSTRRTLLWLMGKQNKIVHHKHSNSMSSNV